MANQVHKDKVLKLIAKQSGTTVEELEANILEDATNDLVERELKNIVENMKTKKINEANIYEPDDTEITSVINNKISKEK